MVIVGSSMFEGLGYTYSTNVKGNVRAFDVRTGKKVWHVRHHARPRREGPRDLGRRLVALDRQHRRVDADHGRPGRRPRLPAPSSRRPSTNTAATVSGDNLFAESLVAVDLKTGKYKWHFQFVHHPIWDHDMSSAPLLIDTTVDGTPRKLVAVPTKQGWLYTFDRITGKPIWPIDEKPVPQTTMQGERTAPTQPFPSKPPAYSRTHVAESDLIDFTPELRKQALENLKHFRWEQIPYVPPTGPESPDKLGSINIANWNGGVNWPGSGFDPETGIFYTQAGNSAVTVGHYSKEEFDKVNPENFKTTPRQPRWEAEPDYGLPRPRRRTAPEAFPGAEGRRKLGEGLNGLPLVKPPYGVMAAIDLKNGSLMFQVPHGDTPDAVREHPHAQGHGPRQDRPERQRRRAHHQDARDRR